MSFSLNLHNLEQLLIMEMSGKILSDGDLETAKASLDKITNWNIVMDLSNLTHSNSSGIAFMVKTLTRSRINNGDVAMVKPNAQLAKLFEITKMHEVFSIYDSLNEAKKHFNK
jgi:anti-sigma B factor antagonist